MHPDVIQLSDIPDAVVRAAASEIDKIVRWEKVILGNDKESISGPHQLFPLIKGDSSGAANAVHWAFWRSGDGEYVHCFSLILTSDGAWFVGAENKTLTVGSKQYTVPTVPALESYPLGDPDLFKKIKVGVIRYTKQYGI